MAEFVEKRCEDMIPQLEQMERIKLFDKNEIKSIAKARKEFEYKIQRHTKNKADYLGYIQYEKDLMKLVKHRRKKFGITAKKSDIDYSIANKIKSIYRSATIRFQDDLSLWTSSMMFCKHVKFDSCVSRIIGRMIQVHQDKPKCWHIAAKWEMEENKNLHNARKFLFAGLHIHQDSQLLYIDLFTLELKEAESKALESSTTADKNEMPIGIKKALVIYKTASSKINNLDFMIKLLNITKDFENTDKLPIKIIADMNEKYSNEPKLWDVMARRELEGLSYRSEDEKMEIDNENESRSLKDKIKSCNDVFQKAVEQFQSEAMWSLYIDCLIEINHDISELPNYKRKLLKNALLQGHEAGKLEEKYYLNWIAMLKEDETSKKKIYQVMSYGTDAIPKSLELWRLKMKYLVNSGNDEQVEAEFNKAIKNFGAEALPIWQMKLLYYQAKIPARVEDLFKAGIANVPEISKAMKVPFIEWLLLTKGIEAARQKYQELSVVPPLCLELHKKMADLEVNQSNICKDSARKPYDIATLQYGKTDVEIWLDYIVFEMKHGDPMKVSSIHRRAIKTLESSKIDSFVTQYSLLLADSENITS